MSLFDEYSDDFTIIDKTTEPDGYGGYNIVWKEGATFKGALAPASQSEVTVAGAMGEKTTHTLVTAKSIILDYHDVLKRSDGVIFRVTNTDGGTYTPGSSSLDMRKYRLEQWSFPMEDENG